MRLVSLTRSRLRLGSYIRPWTVHVRRSSLSKRHADRQFPHAQLRFCQPQQVRVTDVTILMTIELKVCSINLLLSLHRGAIPHPQSRCVRYDSYAKGRWSDA
jgi:hypothetical protein